MFDPMVDHQLMETFIVNGERRLPSNEELQMLSLAYGFTVRARAAGAAAARRSAHGPECRAPSESDIRRGYARNARRVRAFSFPQSQLAPETYAPGQ